MSEQLKWNSELLPYDGWVNIFVLLQDMAPEMQTQCFVSIYELSGSQVSVKGLIHNIWYEFSGQYLHAL